MSADGSAGPPKFGLPGLGGLPGLRGLRGLRPRVLLAAALVLTLQAVLVAGLSLRLADRLQLQLEALALSNLDAMGALADCAERPGPWRDSRGWAASWPVDGAGRLIGVEPPVEAVALPAVAGTLEFLPSPAGRLSVWAAEDPSCAGVVGLRLSSYPVIAAELGAVGGFAALRIGLSVLSSVLLVWVTAVPLVRRIRALEASTRGVVARDFQGAIPHTGPGDELDGLTAAFNEAARAARERLAALNQRDALMRRGLNDLAHDLRTPLATLKLTVGQLESGAGEEAGRVLRAELSYLDGLVRNFDALLRLGAEPGPRERVDLSELVERLGLRFEILARDRGIALAVAPADAPLWVRGDPVALEQAAGNLVQNAVRWARGHVALLVFERDGQCLLEVRDDGPGIDLAELPRLAERRTRGAAAGRGEGFGLGLSIADAAARSHGGQLELAILAEGGTRAALVLPPG